MLVCCLYSLWRDEEEQKLFVFFFFQTEPEQRRVVKKKRGESNANQEVLTGGRRTLAPAIVDGVERQLHQHVESIIVSV